MLSKRNVADALANTIKTLESLYEPTLNPILPFIIRLDGVSFRKYTASMQKPFDPHFTRAMIGTAFGLLERTSARTAFVQSDEITLAFSGDTENKQLLYNGRVQKIASIIAAHASILFNSLHGEEEWQEEAHWQCLMQEPFHVPMKRQQCKLSIGDMLMIVEGMPSTRLLITSYLESI